MSKRDRIAPTFAAVSCAARSCWFDRAGSVIEARSDSIVTSRGCSMTAIARRVAIGAVRRARSGNGYPRGDLTMATDLVDVPRFFDPDDKPLDGTPFGSGAAMTSTIPRQRDRRNAVAEHARRADARARSAPRHFSDARRLRADAAAGRAAADRAAARAGQSMGAAARCRGRPGVGGVRGAWRRPARHRACSRRRSIPDCRLGEWDFQILGIAAHLGALVLEIERSRLQLARAGLGAAPRVRRDGAAPLIGSTPVMQTLRSTDRAGRRHRFHRLVRRRIWRRQGARRASDPRVEPPPERPVRRRQLRGARRDAARGGTVRHRGSRRPPASAGGAASSKPPKAARLFLDEVSDLSLSAQAKLLRAVQDLAIERVGGHNTHQRRHADCRGHRTADCPIWSERRLFRPDLFYRLSGVDVRVPTLRERRPDVLELAEYFLERHRGMRPLRISQLAADALVTYDWPGNVRELERLMERAVTLAESRGPRARRSAADDPRRLRRGARARRSGATTPCARGRAATRGWCSSAARGTSGKRAGCSTSATTRCRHICASLSAGGRRRVGGAGGGGAIDGVRSAAHRRARTCRASPANVGKRDGQQLAARSRVYRNRRSPTWGIRGPSGRGA